MFGPFDTIDYNTDNDGPEMVDLQSFHLTYSYVRNFPHMREDKLLLWFTNMEECAGVIDHIRASIASNPEDCPLIPVWRATLELCEAQLTNAKWVEVMANPPKIATGNLPTLSEDAASATSSPARGKEMRTNLLGKLRPPPLVHAWEFYHDRQDRKKPMNQDDSVSPDSQAQPNYEHRLVKLTDIADVGDFWKTFNNFDITILPLRDSIHLFHKGVKPVWEDKRNEKGGSWTFRVPKALASEFWQEICLMAIGERLQASVETERKTFRDDICGVSLSVRFTSILIQIWNRDGNHQEGIDKILKKVLDELPDELKPKEGTYYYKRHEEHAGYKRPEESAT
ncbi:MAG: hypothetical protein M1821_000177 [Bathelium mastoideum]|nr:MAG: hypothetical protein M1821_000177 [Bathelium mastoideum]KAI9687789.1 MAG: hypothetical protein M1822_001869 [Bathelium mastoideum]